MLRHSNQPTCCDFMTSCFSFCSGTEMSENSTVEEFCGIWDNVVFRIHNSKATFRLITDDNWTEEGFKLTVKPS